MRLALVAAIIAILLWWGGRTIAPRVLPLVAAINRLGPWGPVLFIAVYVIAVITLVPSSWLAIAGGAVFGLVPGVCYALIGATLGASAAFLLGRYAARKIVARRLGSMPRFVAIDRAVSTQGLRIVLLLRLSPVVPFNFLNYALGLTTISFRDFVVASVGMVPVTFLYVYAGKIAGEALALAGQAHVPKGASYYTVLGLGLAATVAAIVIVTRAARRALRDV